MARPLSPYFSSLYISYHKIFTMSSPLFYF
nr:MAG TPA: hypothetical protein [Caudoviricetes sp.]